MPRGNDSQSARAELLERHPDLANVQTAEDLVAAVKDMYPTDLRAASLKKIDERATAELDLDSLNVPKGSQVESATVRGDKVIAVVEFTEGPNEGRTAKLVLDRDDTSGSRRRAEKDDRPQHSGPKRRQQQDDD